MCGIAGFCGAGDADTLKAMTQSLAHRGPDGEGYFISDDPPVFLGHRRLAILDMAGGVQPMWNEDETVCALFNGEIYNHLELRRELMRAGHVFSTDHSDTEVLVHGWEAWGSELPGKLNGMFAFVIFDRIKHQLFLARDRFGEKPLYYSQNGDTFFFASELSALLLHKNFNRDFDREALKKFFAHGYLPAPRTPYVGCHKLPAGNHLTFDLERGLIDVRAYWTFLLEPDEDIRASAENRLVEELQNLLSQAVRRRLMSDVPLGVFLSGGIDSGTVLAFAAQHRSPSEIKTFTIGFCEPSFNESHFARKVAEKIGSWHHEEILKLETARELIPYVLSRMDEPLGDASIVSTYLLSRFTRAHVTVALSGDGGDELFAGYDPFAAITPSRVYELLVPKFLHRAALSLVELLPLSTKNMSFDFKVRRALSGFFYPAKVRAPVWMGPLEPDAIAELFREPVSVEELYSEAISIWDGNKTGSPVDRMLEFFTRMYLQDNILTKVDRATMMASLESRAVFLDNDLVDFCRKLPNHFKYRKGTRKYLLKKATEPFLPQSIINRPKKGFGIPIAKWLRDVPSTPPLTALANMDTEVASRYWTEHRAQMRDHRLFIWSWLAAQFALNNRRQIAKASPRPSAGSADLELALD